MKNRIINEVFILCKEYGLKKLTMSQISSSLRISKKTIYEYFESKDELIEEVIDTYINNNYEIFNLELSKCSTVIEELKISCFLFLPTPYEFYSHTIEEIKLHYPNKYEQIKELIDYKTNKIIEIYEKGVSGGVFDYKINPLAITFMAKSFLETKNLDKSLFESFYEILLYGCIKRDV